tara:strand:+ start:7055 stop:8473 length:1419 start_codon:yes stop_codon:yes gene_type:complete
MIHKYKVIVIGSGPGGCVSALMLAREGIDVLLIEEGSLIKHNELSQYNTKEMQLKYKNSGQTMALGKPIINFVEGKCAGGGSEINSGLYHRIPEEVLSTWEENNEIHFDRDELTSSYESIEKNLSISYMPKNKIPVSSLLLKNGSDSLGWDCSEVPRWYKYDDDKAGKKQSMSETYIPEFLDSGGSFLPDSQVIKIHKNKKNDYSIFVKRKNKEVEEFTCEFIILSAGSINSPNILKKSGLKDKKIGRGLKMHPSFKFTAMFPENIICKNEGVAVHQIKEFSPKISIGCSISSKQYLAVSLNDTNNLHYLSRWENMASYYSMISPEGSGNIHRIPFFNSPLVTFRLTKIDKKNIIKGIKALGKVLFTAGAERLFPSISQDISFTSIDELKKFNFMPLSKLNLMTIHLFSSMRMGGKKERFCVNPDGLLWEDESIMLSDGSILCDSPSVNPQGTIMALAEMNTKKFIRKIKTS